MEDKKQNEKQVNKETEKKEDYRFLKEVIKEKPMNKKAILIRLGWIIGGAVLFGFIAAFVFAQFLPVVEQNNTEQVELGTDDPEAEVTETVTPTEGEPTAAPTAEPTPEPEKSAVEQYELIYSEMNDIAKTSEKFLVTVTGITSDEDWFNMTTESTKQASGVVVADTGQELVILTEYRAVDNVDRVMVTFWDDTIVDGRYQKHDADTGFTVVKVPISDIEKETRDGVAIASLGNSYSVNTGEPVIAIGSPMGYSNSVVHGQVTSTTNTVAATDVQYNLLTTNILGSDSGSGALVNLKGEVIGVIAQEFGSGSENVITGLPISQLKTLIEALSNNSEIPYVGIKGQNVTAEIAKQTGMPRGVYVDSVDADSPALQAGIQAADVIVKFGDTEIENISRYHEQLVKATPGSTAQIHVMRKGAEGYVEFEFAVTLGAH